MQKNKIYGCDIEGLDNSQASEVIDWIEGKKSNFEEGGYRWLLAHSIQGVTWGKYDGQRWVLSSSVFQDLSPHISKEELLELRIFGDKSEIYIWRDGSKFRGRKVSDNSEVPEDFLKCEDEYRILLGNRKIKSKGGFTQVRAPNFREQAVPLEWPNHLKENDSKPPFRLKVRHYFQRDEDTGAVRIALSRLVGIYPEGRGNPNTPCK